VPTVWELESQFRNLGGDYACFSMPFWDITNDADFLSSSTDPDASTIPILLGVLGGNGNADHNHCVEDEPWTVDQYSTEYLCVPPEVPPDCCLKRDVRSEATLPTTTEWTDTMRYARFRDFQDAVSDFHGKVHKLFAADSQSHMFSNNAAEDPLFVLLHSFLDYLRSLRQNCWHFDFEADAVQTLQDHVPFAFDSYDVAGADGELQSTFKPQLDTPLRFELICNLKDARCGREEVTIRKMYDIGSWGISYEPGPFWNDNDGLQALCGELNPQWFYGEDLSVALSAQREEVVISEGDTAARQQHLRDVFNWWLLMAAVIALNVSLVWLLVRKYVMTWKSTNRNARKLVHDEQEAANLVIGESLIRYGTV